MTKPDRETLTRHLAEVEYPCGREELLHRAAASGGGDAVLGPLGALPDDGHYKDIDSVLDAVSAGRGDTGFPVSRAGNPAE
jgi:hypothetical protein